MKMKKYIISAVRTPKIYWTVLIIIIIAGLYLRFYNIENQISFNWDQGRDAWVVRDILNGQLTLLGPRTGVGHMHIGPAYYYMLTPFFYFSQLDPMASNYFNFIANVINFILLFFVTKKLYGNYSAVFVITVYSFSHYLISINQVPWNVTLMPGISALLYYCIIRIYAGSYRFLFLLWFLSGFYFNLHFTAIFLPFINILSLLFVKDRKKTILYSLYSIPLFFIWYFPNIIDFFTNRGEKGLLENFFKYYYVGLHFRFMLHRLADVFVQFKMILYDPILQNLMYIIPSSFAVLVLLDKDKKAKLQGYLLSIWFLVPLIFFTLYGGPISEYYLLFTIPMVLYIILYIQQRMVRCNPVVFTTLLLLFWSYYIVQNTKDIWIKKDYGGLHAQKDDVKQKIERKEKIEYVEGDINSYLYTIWTEGKRF